jgi:hypothetical protein
VTCEEQRTAADRLAQVYTDNTAGIEYGDECLYSAYVLMRDLTDRLTADLLDTKGQLVDANNRILLLTKEVADHAKVRMVAALRPPKDTDA